MKKNKKTIFHYCKPYFISTLLVFLAFSTIAQVSSNSFDDFETIKYSFQNPIVETINIEGTNYHKIIMFDCTPVGEPGEPMVPSRGSYILLPPNSKLEKVNIIPGKKIVLGNQFYIEPMGKPSPISQINSISTPVPDETIYNTNSYYPGKLFTKIGTYNFRGYQLLVLQLHPIQHNPVTGELFYYKDLTVSIETVDVNSPNYMFRGLEKDKLEVMKKVDNPELSKVYDEKIVKPSSIEEDYDLLIITTDSLEAGFEPLKQAHNTKNIKTIIKTLSDIGSDELEDIRDYITNAYTNWGIEYVIIGGDEDVVPDPILWVFGLDENTTPYTTYMPSDLYYACLDGPFNFDGDDKWGEPTDGEDGEDVDLIAEVYIGRACVDNADDVEKFVTKTVSYINKDPEDEYLTNYCLVGEYMGDHGIATWGGNYMDQLIDNCTDDGYSTVGIPSDEYTIDTLYDRDWQNNDWPKSEIIDRVNNGVHIINHLGHSNYEYNLKMHYEDLYDFTNTDLCFVYSQGCMSGGFDYDYSDSIAEHFTVKIDSGAFAGIWNARYGWFWSNSTDGDSQRFHRQFWDAVFGENTPEIGKANQDSKEDNLYIITRSCIRWCYYGLNLFGDPSLEFFEPDSNAPPEIPRKPSEKQGAQFTYTTNTTDPDNDPISYRWQWGDGTYSDWIGPYESGETCEASHAWTEPGNYEIKVQASDPNGGISNWSEPLGVQIDLPIIEIGDITSGIITVNAVIKNIGTAEATGIKAYIKLDGDFIFLGKNTSYENINIAADSEKLVRSGFIFGVGQVLITINADGMDKTANAFIIGPFVFM